MINEIGDSEEFNDDLIKDIVKKGARTISNPDFEKQMMIKIQNESAYMEEVASQLKASLKFFVGALISAIGLTLVVVFGKMLEQYEIKIIAISALFVMSLIGALNIDNYRRLIKKYSW